MQGRRGVMTGGSALLCGLLAGCSGAVVARYYRIAATPGVADGSVRGDIVLRPIVLPGYLNQTGVPEPSPPQTLATFDNHLWAGSLAGLLQASLVRNLAQRLPAATVIGGGGAIDLTGATIVEINVLDFAPDSDGRIDFQADVSIKPASRARLTRDVKLGTATGGTTPDQVVTGMSLVWGQFADRVAALGLR